MVMTFTFKALSHKRILHEIYLSSIYQFYDIFKSFSVDATSSVCSYIATLRGWLLLQDDDV